MDKLNRTMVSVLTQEDFSNYHGLVSLSDLPLTLIGQEGESLYEFVPMPEFCKRVCLQASEDRLPECMRNLRSTNEMCMWHRCSYGLSSFIIPVVYGGVSAAYLAGGNAYEEEQAYQKYMQNVHQLAEQAGMQLELVAKALSLLRTVSKEKLEAHAQLGMYIANALFQKLCGMKQPVQSVEKDILERKIIEQEAKNSMIQVKPDFLFNMLNCIARIAYFERAEKTENLIYQLSDLLRFNAQSGTSLHTVQAELEHIEKYLYIQKARFQARLKYIIDVPEHIRSCHILNSVLQPLVDNALVHGIMLRKDGGEIRLRARSHGERLIFLIIDNGSGFPLEILRQLKMRAPSGGNGSSLQRIDQRLKNYYGEPYGLEIVKSDVSGSTVSVTIPRNIAKR